MTQTRRHFLKTSAASAGAVTFLPFIANAASHAATDVFETPLGPLTVHPVNHASIVLETPLGVIYVDPVGDAAQYDAFPKPGLVLITHEHGDHMNAETLSAVMAEGTQLVTNAGAHAKMTDAQKEVAVVLANGTKANSSGVGIEAIPAYNLSEDRLKFHPKGRDNGYVLSMGDYRIYISGDTQGIPEMRALEGIDLAFVCMNLPFTMDVEEAADAVAEFKPSYVYPYHFRGRDGGTQDPVTFAKLVGDVVKVKMGDWY